jgi:hypothetical protein
VSRHRAARRGERKDGVDPIGISILGQHHGLSMARTPARQAGNEHAAGRRRLNFSAMGLGRWGIGEQGDHLAGTQEFEGVAAYRR